MNEKQVAYFNAMVAAFGSYKRNAQQQGHSDAFFLHGSAGTGKTFLYNCVCSHFRTQRKIVLCVAFPEIAAHLLPGGRTAHSSFKISLTNDINTVCNITQNSLLDDLIHGTSLIIWDQLSMQHKDCFETVNRTLNNVCNSGAQQLFGGIPTVLGGDFAQILSVIRRGARQLTVLASIRQSLIWHHLHILTLRRSMRMIASPENQEFIAFLPEMVTHPLLYGSIRQPPYIHWVSTVDQLCDYLHLQSLLNNAVTIHCTLAGRAILAFRNKTLNDFNDILLEPIPGEKHRFEAVNPVNVAENAAAAEPFAVEYLQIISLASIPPSCLGLKIGAPLILLWNLSPREGLCNGTRMRVLGMSHTCLQVTILGGRFDGMIRLLS